MRQLVIAATTLLLALLCVAVSFAHLEGAPAETNGSPGTEQTCAQCHNSFPVVDDYRQLAMGLPGEYGSNTQYTLSVLIGRQDTESWGMQLTTIDEEGSQAGFFLPSLDEKSQILDNPAIERDYVTHTLAGTESQHDAGQVYQVRWIAPPSSVGTVRGHIAFVAGNGDGTPQGDVVYLAEEEIVPLSSEDPAPELFFFDRVHEFGLTPIGETRIWNVVFYNLSASPIVVHGTTWQHDAGFTLQNMTFPLTIPGRWSDTLHVGFTPEYESLFVDTLRVTMDATPFIFQLSVTGESIHPIAPEPFDLAAPEDGAAVSAPVEFRWHPSLNLDSENPEEVEYSLEFDIESDFMNPTSIPAGTDTTLTLSDELPLGQLFFWRVLAHDNNTPGTTSNDVFALIVHEQSSPEHADQPANFRIRSIYPNPFNEQACITLELPENEYVRATLYSLEGREVAQLWKGQLSAGTQMFSLQAQHLASGLYFLNVRTTSGHSHTHKIILLR